jgi:(p)ppGpp synthase/HD superfamily hydrolase
MKEKAKQFAVRAHKGQVRKTANIPYITHPIRVAEMLEEAGASDALVSAAYLHDVVEDTPVEIEEIEETFGEEVGALVLAHTEDKTKSWKERKQATIDTLKDANSDVAQLIIADRLDNLLSLEKDLAENGPATWDVFNAGYEDQKWYNEELLKNVKDDHFESGPAFFRKFKEVVERIFG